MWNFSRQTRPHFEAPQTYMYVDLQSIKPCQNQPSEHHPSFSFLVFFFNNYMLSRKYCKLPIYMYENTSAFVERYAFAPVEITN